MNLKTRMAHHATQSTVLLKMITTIQYPCAHAKLFYFLQGLQ